MAGAEFAGKISGAVRVPVGDAGKDAKLGQIAGQIATPHAAAD